MLNTSQIINQIKYSDIKSEHRPFQSIMERVMNDFFIFEKNYELGAQHNILQDNLPYYED